MIVITEICPGEKNYKIVKTSIPAYNLWFCFPNTEAEQLELLFNTISGHLFVSHDDPITELPDNLIVMGMLDIAESKIKRLPNNLIVKGVIDINHTSISEIPDDLICYGGIAALFTKISIDCKLPNGVFWRGMRK